MRRLWSALLIAGFGLSTAALAQPPGNQRPRESRGGGETNRGEPNRGGERRGEHSVEGWVRTLAERITDPHDSIRDSARAGLVAVGEPALPILRNLANGNDDARATAAKKLIGAIEGRGGPRTASRPGGPGRPSATGGGFGGSTGRGGPPFAAGGPMPFGRGAPMTGGFPGGPRGTFNRVEGGERRPEGARPVERPEGGERRPDAPRPVEGRPMEQRRPEGGERRPDAPRPVEGRPMERRPENGERRPEAPRPTERRPD